MPDNKKTRPFEAKRKARGDVIQSLTSKAGLKQELVPRQTKGDNRLSLSSFKKAWRGDVVTENILGKIANFFDVTIEDISDRIEDEPTSPEMPRESDVEDGSGRNDETADERQPLIDAAICILERSEDVRRVIIETNQLRRDLTATELCDTIFLRDNPEVWPMTYLARCVGRVSEEDRSKVARDICLLADVLVPVSVSIEEVEPLRKYLQGDTIKATDKRNSHTAVGTRFPLIASAAVGSVKGYAVDTREPRSFDDITREDRPDGTEVIGSLPFPPIRRKRDIVNDFAVLLERLLAPYGGNGGSTQDAATAPLELIQAALRGAARDENIHFCVLFPPSNTPSKSDLDKLHIKFPELVLLKSLDRKEPLTNNDVLHQVKRIRDYFCDR